jgi:SAM-dependent methyltransferase
VAVDRTRAAYDRIAGAYVERNVLPPTSPAVLEMVDRFVALLPAGARVLDLGCGPAHESAWLRERGLDAVGGDLSDGMLAQARRFFPGGPLVQLDMRGLPFAERSFAAVWCMASLLHIPTSEAPGVLTEVRRVLRGPDLLALALQEGDGERWDGGYVEGVERFFARYSPTQARRLIEGAGFDVEWYDRNVTATPNRVWLRFVARARR